MWRTISFHCFSEEFQCCFSISALRNVAFQHFAFVIHSRPEIVGFSVDFYEHFVQVPLPIRMSAKVLNPFSSDLRGKQRAKSVSPETDSFMANINTAFVQQIFHISKRKRKPNIHHQSQTDDLWARLKVAKRRFCHPQMLRNRPTLFKSVSSDSAPRAAKARL